MTTTALVSASSETTSLAGIAVTAAPGSAGTAVSGGVASNAALLTNTSRACAIQYKVGSGAWNTLNKSEGVNLPINMASDVLYLRRLTLDGGLAFAHVDMNSVPTLSASGGAVEGGGTVGTFATTAALQIAFPAAANAGKAALVGTVAPYAIYDSNGVSWAVRGSG